MRGEPVPARLYVLLATQAPVGLILRRGPTSYVCTIRWDRRNDAFKVGQWLRGRIYEDFCDLSPDGKHFIYFARKKDPYTAISRAPYLKAVVLIPQRDGWGGGGLFTAPRTYALSRGEGAEGASTKEVRFDPAYPLTEPSVLAARLLRDGWRRVKPTKAAKGVVFEKPIIHGWVLQRIEHTKPKRSGKSSDLVEHRLIQSNTGLAIEGPDWEWADFADGRVYWAAKGKLWAAKPFHRELVRQKELADFNAMKYEQLLAPY
ncbi:MAG: hypothetical protein KIS92_05170 [Planctomycetota bacterium]|nr:hypothetical protein [Planctomycetota bacterium]